MFVEWFCNIVVQIIIPDIDYYPGLLVVVRKRKRGKRFALKVVAQDECPALVVHLPVVVMVGGDVAESALVVNVEHITSEKTNARTNFQTAVERTVLPVAVAIVVALA